MKGQMRKRKKKSVFVNDRSFLIRGLTINGGA